MDLRFFLCSAMAASLLSCAKETDDEDYRPASIEFRDGSGYTFLSDTFAMGDTLHVGVIVNEGSEALRTFYADRRYDAGPSERFDSLRMDGFPFVYDTLLVLRDAPGTEKWIFTAEEYNGDRTARILTFVTQ